MRPFKSILVPVDFGVASQKAIDLGVELASRFDAALRLVHVWQVPTFAYTGAEFAIADAIVPLQQAAQQALDEVLAKTKQVFPSVTATMRSGAPWSEVLDVARECGADLIVLGTHGRGPLGHFFLGSVAERVVRASPVPVLTLHADPEKKNVAKA